MLKKAACLHLMPINTSLSFDVAEKYPPVLIELKKKANEQMGEVMEMPTWKMRKQKTGI